MTFSSCYIATEHLRHMHDAALFRVLIRFNIHLIMSKAVQYGIFHIQIFHLKFILVPTAKSYISHFVYSFVLWSKIYFTIMDKNMLSLSDDNNITIDF